MQTPLAKSIGLFSLAILFVAVHAAAAAEAVAEPLQQPPAAKASAAQAPAGSTTTTEPGRPAEGAAVARSFAELATKIEPGDTVYVTRQAGERTRAKVQGFDAGLETLYFNADGASFGLTQTELSQLELRYNDSRVNGVVVGAVAGSGIFIIAGVACALVDGCNAASETFAAAALFGGIGAGIGFAIDSSVKTERLVYVSPTTGSMAFALRPVMSHTRKGAVVVLTF